jgi:hypothetical protein
MLMTLVMLTMVALRMMVALLMPLVLLATMGVSAAMVQRLPFRTMLAVQCHHQLPPQYPLPLALPISQPLRAAHAMMRCLFHRRGPIDR